MPNRLGVPAAAHTPRAGQEHPGSGGRGTAGTRALQGSGGQGCLQLWQRHCQAQGLGGHRPSPQGSLLEKSGGWGAEKSGGRKGRWGGGSVSESRTGPRTISLLSGCCHYPSSQMGKARPSPKVRSQSQGENLRVPRLPSLRPKHPHPVPLGWQVCGTPPPLPSVFPVQEKRDHGLDKDPPLLVTVGTAFPWN